MNPYVTLCLAMVVTLIGVLGFILTQRRVNSIFQEILENQYLGTFTYRPVRYLGGGLWEYAPDSEGQAKGLPTLKMTVEQAEAENRAARRAR